MDHGAEDADSCQVLCEGHVPTNYSRPLLGDFPWP